MSSSKPYKLDQVGIRMVKEPPLYSAEPVNSPQAAVRLMSQTLKGYDRAVLAVVNLRNDLKPINMNIVSIGTLNQSLAHPRDILKSIILSNAGSVMLFHNHPSGNLMPSPDDISLTDRSDHTPRASFVLPAKAVHENQYVKSLWAKIPAGGHTTITKPYVASQSEDGKNIWKDEKTIDSNRELKSMVEFYKKDLVPKYDIPEL